MLCQSCGANESQFHFTSNVNGEITEMHLCSECASKVKGLDSVSETHNSYVNSFLQTIFPSAPIVYESGLTCSLCGATAHDLQSSGKVGCASCYDTFSAMLLPYIRRIHGNAAHIGKTPMSAGPEYKLRRKINDMKHDLESAVSIQDYERAAILRDKIRELEGGSLDVV